MQFTTIRDCLNVDMAAMQYQQHWAKVDIIENICSYWNVEKCRNYFLINVPYNVNHTGNALMTGTTVILVINGCLK